MGGYADSADTGRGGKHAAEGWERLPRARCPAPEGSSTGAPPLEDAIVPLHPPSTCQPCQVLQ